MLPRFIAIRLSLGPKGFSRRHGLRHLRTYFGRTISGSHRKHHLSLKIHCNQFQFGIQGDVLASATLDTCPPRAKVGSTASGHIGSLVLTYRQYVKMYLYMHMYVYLNMDSTTLQDGQTMFTTTILKGFKNMGRWWLGLGQVTWTPGIESIESRESQAEQPNAQRSNRRSLFRGFEASGLPS